jgi:4-hydroxy-tetrahydrodipicolinate reductase
VSEPLVSAATGVCVLGPSGRMGREVLALCGARSNVRVVAAVDAPGSEIIGSEVCAGVVATADLAAGLARADVYIDFTTPAATRRAAEQACERGVAAVIGTTGLDAAAEAAIARLSERAPVLVAANFSLGVNVLLGLAERAARALGQDFDIEIVELHHKHKRDAPSGTALALAGALNRGRGDELALRLERAGDVGARPENELGVMALRGGDVAGEHTAYFLGPGERLEITHRAGSRSIFAAGALRAAAWLAGKPAGRYSMSQVLGL